MMLTDSFNPVVACERICMFMGVSWFVDDRNDNETLLYDMTGENGLTLSYIFQR